ncbi:hypothetical protein SAMN05216188_12449 [Lentzea xinjiangensis]|uniref:Uncharacterized protein n=1 Tax=Lentzea xinjiangensis TaxID=402600 RepID=A0A1H9V551_9PSEU|nr:hypothetical protein [Lentzea xinjiangensis]SES16845.1 hypothetical protein SAMN05216188_12449 [Lentzea xinjiangensis]
MPVGSTPSVHLIHVVEEEATWQGHSMSFTLQPIPVRRPARGRAEAALECARCGLPVWLRIRSARATVRRRRAWLSMALLSWVVAPSPLVAWELVPQLMFSLSNEQTLSVIGGSLLLFFFGLFALIRFMIEDGVRMSEGGRRWRAVRDGCHGLRRVPR